MPNVEEVELAMGKILTKEIAQKLLEKADSADLSKYLEL